VIIFDQDKETIVLDGPGHSLRLTRPLARTFIAGEEPQSGGGMAVSDDDRTYYQERAEAEIELAQAADHEGAVRSHYLLAGYYLDRVHSDEQAPS
jgi:hypothetical protein